MFRTPAIAVLSGALVAAGLWLTTTVGAPPRAPEPTGGRIEDVGRLEAPRTDPRATPRSAVETDLRSGPASDLGARPVAPPTKTRACVLRVLGTVFRADGTPATRASVSLGASATSTDRDGRFDLRCAVWPEDGVVLIARERGWGPAIVDRPIEAVGTRAPGVCIGPLRLWLGDRLGAVQGEVVDGAGQPQKGWRIGIEREDMRGAVGHRAFESLLAGPGGRGMTGRDGQFVLPDVRAGLCRLVARRGKRRVETELDVPADGLEGVRVVVE